MRQADSARERPAAAWPRRLLVSLWVLAFGLAGGVLAARWDTLMARLARPVSAGETGGGALR